MAYTVELPILDATERAKQAGARTSTPTAVPIDAIIDGRIEPQYVMQFRLNDGSGFIYVDVAVESPGHATGPARPDVPAPRYDGSLAVSLSVIPGSEAGKASGRSGHVVKSFELRTIRSLLSGAHTSEVHADCGVLNGDTYVDFADSAARGLVSAA